MTLTPADRRAVAELGRLAASAGLDVVGGTVRRTSSRFCLGVEHGDYNGTELFGVGTDRFIWLASKPNDSGLVRLLSGNFPEDGVVAFAPGAVPAAGSAEIAGTWGRFPFGVDAVLRRDDLPLTRGADVVIHGDIPGGGMSRSASLTVNLILSLAEANGLPIDDPMRVARLAQAVENDYVGSPCGLLDQVMILFAREGMGTHYNPDDGTVRHLPLGDAAPEFRLVGLDTGTVRPGLESSTYRQRRAECEELASMIAAKHGIGTLAGVRTPELLERVLTEWGRSHPGHCRRLLYIYQAQARFGTMLAAWREGDLATVGRVFREDGFGLRDLYRISGPELESMCDIARTVPGVLGERMLGGGDKGAAGALVLADGVDALREAVRLAYPRSHPELADSWSVEVLRTVDGVATLDRGCWSA